MVEVREIAVFSKWLKGLRDQRAKARIASRIERVKDGNFGDHRIFGKIGELKLDFGPGYRVYFTRRGEEVVILLCGGDKSTQQDDIAKAEKLEAELDDDEQAKEG